jgi:hypothetical protein
MAKKLKIKTEAPLVVRHREGLNQAQFWGLLGTTQSGGSRYETGRAMPKTVRMLWALRTGVATVEQLRSGELSARI